jgi:hypothetical protein
MDAARFVLAPSTMPNMVSFADDDVAIAVHTSLAPSADEWAEWMRLVSEINANHLRVLVFTDGGGPEARQRSQFINYVSEGRPLIAVLSSAMKARLIVTAISWFVPGMKHFPATAAGYGAATEHLSLSQETATRMRTKIRRLCTKLSGGVPASLPTDWW